MKELHGQKGEILLIPEDVEDEMCFDKATVGTIIEFPNAQPGQMEECVVLDRIVCFKVRATKVHPAIPEQTVPKKKRKGLLSRFFEI